MLPDPHLKAAMMALPEQFRTAVYFADIAGYSYKEIAEMTDTRQGTVSSRLNRGRKQLRDLLIDSPVNYSAKTIDEAPSRATQTADRRQGRARRGYQAHATRSGDHDA